MSSFAQHVATVHTPEDWHAVRRDLLAKLKSEIEPFAQSATFDAAAYRAAPWATIASLSQLTQAIPFYLARKFHNAQKVEICAHHYSWMLGNVAPSPLTTLIERWLPLWAKEAGGTVYRVMLRVEQRLAAREGEMTLRMLGDDLPHFSLSFSVIPAALIGRPSGPALLVSRMQGVKDQFETLRRASRALSDVAPRAVAFAVLTGIARACGVDHIAGVAAENYITYMPERRDELVRQYDEFFQALNAEGPRDGLYILDLRAPPKPMSEVKVGHRVRTRRKRALKEEIAAATAEVWARRFALPRG